MKKFISIFFIFLFLSLSVNIKVAFAEPKVLTQGLYTLKDVQLSTGINYNVRNISPSNRSLLIIVDSNQMIQEMIRLGPDSQKYNLKPLNYGDIIIIIGASNLEFS